MSTSRHEARLDRAANAYSAVIQHAADNFTFVTSAHRLQALDAAIKAAGSVTVADLEALYEAMRDEHQRWHIADVNGSVTVYRDNGETRTIQAAPDRQTAELYIRHRSIAAALATIFGIIVEGLAP